MEETKGTGDVGSIVAPSERNGECVAQEMTEQNGSGENHSRFQSEDGSAGTAESGEGTASVTVSSTTEICDVPYSPKQELVDHSEDEEVVDFKVLDRYGFLIDEKRTAPNMGVVSLARNRQSDSSREETPEKRKRRLRFENLRFEKWVEMTSSEERLEDERSKHPARFKRRIRKGIPDAFRQKVWPVLCGSQREHQLNPGVYKALLHKALHNPSLEKVHESISRDVGRTFPRHVIFYRGDGVGQKALGNILRAYSLVDEEVGYCQGMGFIVGLLLGYLGEEESFWVLKTLMLQAPWHLAELYKPGMRGAQLLLFQFEALLDLFLPDVSRHLKQECIVPSMYATQWFITVFAYNFPFDIVVRVWDVFLHEGWKVVFRVAVTIIKRNKHHILGKSMEQILEYFRGIPPKLDAHALLDEAFQLKLKTSHLQAIEQDFIKQNPP